jgi:chemotaxis protein CheD
LEETSVGMGELHVAGKDTILSTFVGSCIALCLYDPESKVGGMAHVLLPDSSKDTAAGSEAKYADRALENTLKLMIEKGARQERLVAKIAGGAKIFAREGSEDVFNIGVRNAEAVKGLLQKKGISVVGEDVGMRSGRWVIFDTSSGKVKVTRRNTEDKIL